jgi:hypothetical protein
VVASWPPTIGASCAVHADGGKILRPAAAASQLPEQFLGTSVARLVGCARGLKIMDLGGAVIDGRPGRVASDIYDLKLYRILASQLLPRRSGEIAQE